MVLVRYLQLCLLLSVLSVNYGQDCLSVNDILPKLPMDLQKLIRSRMDVFAFKGTFFVPTETAWKSRDLNPTFYTDDVLRSILDLSIIPGVRFAERPALKNGTEHLESKFQDTKKLLCLSGDRPDNKIDVEIRVFGKPSATDTTRFALAGTPGNRYKAGAGEIQILKVYSDILIQNLTLAAKSVQKLDATRDINNINDKIDDKKQKYKNLTNIASWTPANVVQVVQCQNADVFFVDHLILPCPLCGKNCSATLVNKLVQVLLPVMSVFAVVLAVSGYVAICCGCNLCASADGVCGFFWKCICRSLVLIIVLLELLVVASFSSFAWYINDFSQKQVTGDKKKWHPYLIWAIVGAVVSCVVVLSHVWSFISQARKRHSNKQHKQFYDTPPPPVYHAVGAAPPIRY